ncbi:hypothetical protein ACQPX6_21805 [Actinomycetospora sp. CA-101289]
MSERTDRTDPTDGVSEPGVSTPHRTWVRVVTLIVLAVFVLGTLVGALLV